MWIIRCKLLSNFKCNISDMVSLLDLGCDPEHAKILIKISVLIFDISFVLCKIMRIFDSFKIKSAKFEISEF
jgi:hypothetical protein